MNNPYLNLIRAVWRNGVPWHRSIIGYYLAYIVAQACMSLSPYAFGRTIDLLQHFTPERHSLAYFWGRIGAIILVISRSGKGS